MQYSDVPKMREQYPFLAECSDREVMALLLETSEKCPGDTGFSNACRLELMYRSKQRETHPAPDQPATPRQGPDE